MSDEKVPVEKPEKLPNALKAERKIALGFFVADARLLLKCGTDVRHVHMMLVDKWNMVPKQMRDRLRITQTDLRQCVSRAISEEGSGETQARLQKPEEQLKFWKNRIGLLAEAIMADPSSTHSAKMSAAKLKAELIGLMDSNPVGRPPARIQGDNNTVIVTEVVVRSREEARAVLAQQEQLRLEGEPKRVESEESK